MQKIIGVTDLQRRFRAVFDDVSKALVPYVLTRGSRPQAALIPYEMFVRYQQMQENGAQNRVDAMVKRLAERSADYETEAVAADVEDVEDVRDVVTVLVDVRLTAMGVDKHAIKAFCQRHHIRKLSLFGSVTRSDFKAESDVDVLVEFDPAFTPGFEFFSMQEELSQLLGRQVYLQTPGFLQACQP